MDSLDIETSNGLQHVDLDQPRLTIGRLPGNDIVLPFLQISRHHAEIRQRGEDWWIIDVGSTNGLIVKGKRLQEYRMSSNDHILLAPSIVLIFKSQRKPKDITIEGTVQLPSVHAVSLPVRSPVFEPDEPAPVNRLASAVSMPIPRRDFVAHHIPPVPSNPEFTKETEDPNKQTIATHMVPPPPTAADLSRNPRDLPIQTPFSLQRQQALAANHTQHLKKPILYLCPTCGERTAPDSPYCWSCRHAIAQPCRSCQMYLLPIQAKCPRCHASNPHTVR